MVDAALLDEVERLLRAEKGNRRSSITNKLERFQTDPVGFVEDVLLGFLWSKQKEIARSVVENRRTAVQSCHDTGKTALAARICAWWLSVWPPGEAFVVSSAPTFDQVRALLWREIGRVHAAGHLPGRVNQTEWHRDGELVGFGRSPADTDPAAFQGVHARRVMVVFDEACGIGGLLWPPANSLIANAESRFLAIGNPDDPLTEFANVCKPGSGWNTIRVDAFDSPNFTGEPIPEWLSRLLVSKTWVEECRRDWGENSPLWTSKVRGEFPESSEDSLVTMADLRAACERILPADGPNDLGVDVARFGSNKSVIYHRHGPVARCYARLSKRDTMHVVGVVMNAIEQTGATRVKIDDIGVGGGVTDRLNELFRERRHHCEVIGVNVGDPSPEDIANKEDEDKATTRFLNLRAELNWRLRERFVAGEIDLDPDDRDMLAQATEIRYRFTSTGKIQMEPKADMVKRLQKRGLLSPSPDDWDALVLAFGEVDNFSVAEFIKAWAPSYVVQ